MELLLRTFRARIPTLPRSALIFAESLQKTLVVMVNKPPSVPAHSPLIQELIACYCVTILTLTHDYKILLRTLQACLTRSRKDVSRSLQAAQFRPDKALALVISMTALLAEHGDFDRIRDEQPDLELDFDKTAPNGVLESVFAMLVELFSAPHESARLIALQSLGFLLRSHALLWTRQETIALMDGIFASSNSKQKELMMRILSEYLSKEQRKRELEMDNLAAQALKSAKKGVDMSHLTGNTEAFADSR